MWESKCHDNHFCPCGPPQTAPTCIFKLYFFPSQAVATQTPFLFLIACQEKKKKNTSGLFVPFNQSNPINPFLSFLDTGLNTFFCFMCVEVVMSKRCAVVPVYILVSLFSSTVSLDGRCCVIMEHRHGWKQQENKV